MLNMKLFYIGFILPLLLIISCKNSDDQSFASDFHSAFPRSWIGPEFRSNPSSINNWISLPIPQYSFHPWIIQYGCENIVVIKLTPNVSLSIDCRHL